MLGKVKELVRDCWYFVYTHSTATLNNRGQYWWPAGSLATLHRLRHDPL